MQTCCYEMLLDILYPDWIQNQKSYIENMLFIILTYHEINRNSIFAPLHLNLSVTIDGQCSGRCFPQGDVARCEAKSRVGQCQNAIYCILTLKGRTVHSAPYRPGRLGISMPSA